MSKTGAVGVKGRKSRRADSRERVREQTFNQIARLFPNWVAKQRSLTVTKADVARLLSRFEDSFETADQLRWARRTLSAVLDDGARNLGWTVETMPQPVVRIPRPMSPFEPNTFRCAHALAGVVAKHQKALEKPPADLIQDPVNRAGQLLFSAIVSGALMCRPLVEALPAKIAEPLNLYGGYFWFDFQLNADDLAARPAYRRWIPDPITACLILRWRLDGLVWPEKSVSDLLNEYLKKVGVKLKFALVGTSSAGVAGSRRGVWCQIDAPLAPLTPRKVRVGEPTILDFLLTGAETRAREWVPATLVDFAVNLRAGASLSPTAWWRTITNEVLAPPVKDRAIDEQASGDLIQALGVNDISLARSRQSSLGTEDQWKLFCSMRSCLSTDGKRLEPAQAKDRLERFKGDHWDQCSHVLQALWTWAHWCLESRAFGYGAIKVSSTLRYINAVGRGLISNGSEVDLTLLAPEGYVALYESALKTGARSDAQRVYMRDRLAEFHDFLRLAYEAPAISWQGSELQRQMKFPDANLVTESEFARVLEVLGATEAEREAELNSLIAIFGHRLGMRRDEIAGLQLDSIQGVVDPRTGELTERPLLWVHVTEWSDVKRTSSARRLPLALLLTPKEFKLLERWIARRFREAHGRWEGQRLLFTETAGSTAKIGDAPFRTITAVMHAVTGDPSLHFHHFRHGFISLLDARMLAVEDPGGRHSLPPTWVPSEEKLRRNALLKALFRQDQPPRQMLYQIAALAGHLDPQESLQSYNHCFDWLLERHMALGEWPITLGLIANLRNASYSSVAVAQFRAKQFGRNNEAAALGEREAAAAAESLGMRAIFEVERDLISEVNQRGWATAAPTSKAYAPLEMDSGTEESKGLMGLSLDDVYALALSSTQGMAQTKRADLFELRPEDTSRLLAAMARRAGTPTAARDKKRRAARHLARQGDRRAMPSPRKVPEVSGIGPALPTAVAELKDARRVFGRLKAGFVENPEQAVRSLEAFAACVNKNNAELTSNKAEVVEALAGLMRVAGIEQHRIRVSLLSWPTSDPESAKKRLSDLFGVAQKNIAAPKRNVQARGGSIHGRISLEVTAPFKKSQAHLSKGEQRLGHGWKVACYYALCLADAIRQSVPRKRSPA